MATLYISKVLDAIKFFKIFSKKTIDFLIFIVYNKYVIKKKEGIQMNELTPTSKITLKEILEICEGLPVSIEDSYGHEIYADDNPNSATVEETNIEKVIQKYGDWIVYSLDLYDERELPVLWIAIWNP